MAIREASERGDAATVRRAETSMKGTGVARVRLRPQDQGVSVLRADEMGEDPLAEIGEAQPRRAEKRAVV